MHLQIQPRFKYKVEGDQVAFGDTITLLNVKLGDHYLHLSSEEQENYGPLNPNHPPSTTREVLLGLIYKIKALLFLSFFFFIYLLKSILQLIINK